MCLEIGIRAAVILAAYRWNVHAIHNGEERLLGDFGNLPVMVEKVIRYHQGEYCIRIFCTPVIIVMIAPEYISTSPTDTAPDIAITAT